MKYRVTTDNQTIEFPTQALAEQYNFLHGTSYPIDQIPSDPSPVVDMAALIDRKIQGYQDVAPKLLRELYVANTLAGISAAQSDQMFDDYADVLLRIREGAFPTALRRLQYKRPSGFVTQTLIDAWRDKILAYL